MRRELGIALGARLTWLVAAASALLVGHGFVLSIDLFSASSRSALMNALSAREMDPLAGIVRPTLGGVDLALSLLAPLIAARTLAIEKERRTFGALCLLEGSSTRVVLKKLAAAVCATALILVSAVACFLAYTLEGGHLDAIETGIAVTGEALHLLVVTAISVAAAAWTRTLAQAATLGVLVSLSSWAIDAAEGFAALAWLGGASTWSIERSLEPFQRGVVSVAALGWLISAFVAATVLAVLGARFDLSGLRRAAAFAVPIVGCAALLAVLARSHRGYDWSEQRRASLPPAVVERLRAIPGHIALDVFLDRDDSRRRQFESDVLAKLRLARPDLVVSTPLDEVSIMAEGQRGDGYGKVLIHVGDSTIETRSTSRREVTTLIFEAARLPPPDWSQPAYAGYPHVVEGPRRTALVSAAYVVFPISLLALGIMLTRRRLAR